MKSKVLIQLVCVLYCICMVSCQKKTMVTPNYLYLYAPGNKVSVNYMKAEYHNGEKPTLSQITETFSDSDVHVINGVVNIYEGGEPVPPEANYYYLFTAGNNNEYYVYTRQTITVNGEQTGFLEQCKKYTPEIIFKALKEQAPNQVYCISSTTEQTIKGDYFNNMGLDTPLTIEDNSIH